VRAAKEVGHSPQFRAAVLLASAWAFDEGSKSAARMIAKIPDQILLPFLDRVALDGIDLGEMGQRLLEYADKHDVSLGDVESIKTKGTLGH
jgi:HEAT repeat protein